MMVYNYLRYLTCKVADAKVTLLCRIQLGQPATVKVGTILKQSFAIGGIILPIKLYCSLLSSQYFNATSIILFAVTYLLCYG